MIIYHIAAFMAGFIMDLFFGDPYWMPHPVRFMGKFIGYLEKKLNKKTNDEGCLKRRGILLVTVVVTVTATVTMGIVAVMYTIHPYAGCIAESFITYQLLAARCLEKESSRVYEKLKNGTIDEARYAVSMIVGRDTKELDEKGVIKAAVETVAENTSDGVIAPMLYLALFGPVLGAVYKAVNTMDSMVGYKNERYMFFGRAAARLDDAVNYIPARISAYLMIASAFICGKEFDGRRAYYIYKRDKRKHASPNSAHTEAVCAGALGIRLAGDAFYSGKLVKKPYIGDAVREVKKEDIKRTQKLMYMAAWMCEALCLGIMAAIVLI